MMRSSSTANAGGPVGIREAFDPRMIAVASVTMMGSFMSMLDMNIVNIALPTLLKDFRTSLPNVQWVTTSYTLALAVVVPLTRWAADRFGTRRVWLVSVTLFTLGSLMCGLAWSLPSLVVARVIQGIGGGMIMPTGQTILAREAGPRRLGRVMTVVAVPQFLAPILGVVAGGLILAAFSWRWVFFINIPIGIIAVLRGRRILEPGDFGNTRRLDVLGMFLLSPGLGLMVYGIAQFGNVGQMTPIVTSTFLGGAALLAVFVVHSLHIEQPLLNLRLLRNRSLAGATTVVLLFGSGLQGAIILFQLYFQLGRGYSPLHTALLFAPGALGAMIALPKGGTIMDRHGARNIVPIGILIMCISVLPFTQVGPETSVLLLTVLWFVRGLGTGVVGTPATAAAYSTLRREDIPGATTINNISGRVGSSFSVAIVAVLLQRRLAEAIPHASVASLSALPASKRVSDAVAISHSFREAFWVTIVLVGLAIIPAQLLPKRREIARLRQMAEDSKQVVEIPVSAAAVAVAGAPELTSDQSDNNGQQSLDVTDSQV
jgi:EmrB/QacA subfamily drug resistance transporter